MVQEKINRVVDAKDLDRNFKFEVAERAGGEKLKACFACGTCTAGCPVREVNDRYNPRRIIRMILLGMRKEVLESDFIWLCSTCYTCSERCPQGVNIPEIMNVLKNMAVEAGRIPSGAKAQADLIRTHGRLYEIDEFDNKKREKANLPPVQSKCDAIAKIFEVAGLDEVLKKG